jgi:transposase
MASPRDAFPPESNLNVWSCFQAGRDGFWLHRLRIAHGVANHVMEPTSILLNRRAPRAKTDWLDEIRNVSILLDCSEERLF